MRRAVAQVFARPEYRWVDSPVPLRAIGTAIARALSWLGALERRHPGASRTLVIALAVVVVALIAHLAYVLWSVTRPTARTPGSANALAATSLDTPDARRARADALARAGRFTEALAQRFVAVVLELDRHRLLTFQDSKTPAEYLSEARLDDAGRRFLGDLVTQLYRHVFGAVPCDERAYREFAAAAATLER